MIIVTCAAMSPSPTMLLSRSKGRLPATCTCRARQQVMSVCQHSFGSSAQKRT
jgi:hypothetical protein